MPTIPQRRFLERRRVKALLDIPRGPGRASSCLNLIVVGAALACSNALWAAAIVPPTDGKPARPIVQASPADSVNWNLALDRINVPVVSAVRVVTPNDWPLGFNTTNRPMQFASPTSAQSWSIVDTANRSFALATPTTISTWWSITRTADFVFSQPLVNDGDHWGQDLP